jgi:two-component system, LuxR family, sensor kinase FixL
MPTPAAQQAPHQKNLMSDSPDKPDRAGPSKGGRLQDVLEHAAAGMAFLTDDDRYEWVNEAFCRLLGYTKQELLGTTWMALTHPADLQAGLVRLGHIKAGSIHSYQVEKRWIHKSGGVVSSVESVCAVRDSDTGTFQILCHVHHAAESKHAAAGLVASERLAAIGQMAAGLAHESRNALQQIGACAEMLAMELQHLPEALDLVVGVQEAEARLHRMFEDVRAFAIPLHLERRKCDLADLWRSAWAMLVASNPKRQLRIAENITAHSGHSSVAAIYLEQVFLKILENSLDACADPVEVEVCCWPTELGNRPAVGVSLRDSGTGFAPEALEKVFEPFYSTKTQGTGLGLPIVRRIIEAHGGQAHAENAVQGGALVRFLLPRDS